MKKIITQGFTNSAIVAVMLFVMFSPFGSLVSQAQVQTGVTTGPTLEQAKNPAPGADTGSSIGCDFSNLILGNTGGTFALCLTNVIYVFTVGIGSGFAYVAAYFFDFAINISLKSASYALTFIAEGWATARDIANMAFLFILIYIAFKVMFEADTANTVHMLTAVIVIALLVNFSFFFSRLAIDAGNILAIQFYNAIDAPAISDSSTAAATAVSNTAGYLGATGFNNTKDLTASIMGMLQLQNLFSTGSFTKFFNGGNAGFLVTTIALSFLYIAAAIMFWLLTVAFVTNGVKFLIRVVVLWFLIIASPLAFVAYAVPKFEDYFKQWLNALISNSLYPVAFLFIFLILSKFASQMSQSNSLINGLFNGLETAPGGSPVASIGYAAANVFIRLGFVISILYVGFEASKKISNMGGTLGGAVIADKAGKWVGGRYKDVFKRTGAYAGQKAAEVPAWAGRNTLGWAGNAAAGSAWARKWEAQTGLKGIAGRGVRLATGAVGRASFDVRNAPIVGKGLATTLGLGAGQKGGYATQLKERTEAKEKRAKAVEPSDGQKEQAKFKANKEFGPQYQEQEKTFTEASTQYNTADARLRQLINDGRENSGEAQSLRLQKIGHEAERDKSKRKMEQLESQMKEREKKLSGEGLSKEYANSMTTRNMRNLWIPFRASKEAGAKIRHGKSNEKKIAEAAIKAAKEADEESRGPTKGAEHAAAKIPEIKIPPAAPKKEESQGDGH